MSQVHAVHWYANAKSADGAFLTVSKASRLLEPLILQQQHTRKREWEKTDREKGRQSGRADCPLEKTAHTDKHLKDVNKGFCLSIYLNGEDNVDSRAESAWEHKWCLSSSKLQTFAQFLSLDFLTTSRGPLHNADETSQQTDAFPVMPSPL